MNMRMKTRAGKNAQQPEGQVSENALFPPLHFISNIVRNDRTFQIELLTNRIFLEFMTVVCAC